MPISIPAESGADKTKPRFAIVSAVYNVARYLADFIESVERQTFDLNQLEVVMVDDGSTDNSLELLRAWEKRRPELVRVLTKQNGGQASARNVGLNVASAEWVTFVDPDDWVNDEYFKSVDAFLTAHGDDVDMVATNRILFEEARDGLRDGHPLRRMFTSDQLVSLLRFPRFFHGSAPASFLRLARIEAHDLRFDERVRPNFEDGHFCVRYLLDAEDPKVGFLKSAEYYYRKRADNSSTLATSVQQSTRFTEVPRHGYLDALKRAASRFGSAPEWLQNMVLYELSWYFSEEDKQSGAASAATGGVGAEFVKLLGQISAYLDETVVRSFGLRRYEHVWREILLYGVTGQDWHTPHAVITKFDRRRNMVQLAYRYTGKAPFERIVLRGRVVEPAHPKLRSYEFFGCRLIHERLIWVKLKGTLRIELNDAPVELRTDWLDERVVTDLRPGAVARRLPETPKRPRRTTWPRWLTGGVRDLFVRVDELELAVSGRSVGNSLIRWLSRLPPIQAKFNGAWVLIDRIHDANDSAETLFHHLRHNRPDVNAWFVLEADTADWERMEQESRDRLVAHGSLQWKLLMLNCDKLISSHIDDPIHEPPDILELRLPDWDFVFLQHGVIKDDISRWLNERELSLFVTSTSAEYDSIVRNGSPYVFSTREVVLSGLPRFDALEAARVRTASAPQNLVIVAPTWRHWLNAPLETGSHRRRLAPAFEESNFVRQWRGVLDAEEWRSAEWASDLELILLPHPNLHSAANSLSADSSIRVLDYSDPNLHDYFARAAVLITDYSSMAFNAAYLNRPVVYFQFDATAVMSGGHVGRKGYFDYHEHGFGPVCRDPAAVVSSISEIARRGGASELFRTRIEKTFPFRDGGCCERVIEAIAAL